MAETETLTPTSQTNTWVTDDSIVIDCPLSGAAPVCVSPPTTLKGGYIAIGTIWPSVKPSGNWGGGSERRQTQGSVRAEKTGTKSKLATCGSRVCPVRVV